MSHRKKYKITKKKEINKNAEYTKEESYSGISRSLVYVSHTVPEVTLYLSYFKNKM